MIGKEWTHCPHCDEDISWTYVPMERKTYVTHGDEETEFTENLYRRIGYSPIKTWLHKIHGISSLDIF